jgi:hypothetical protein
VEMSENHFMLNSHNLLKISILFLFSTLLIYFWTE